MSAFIVNVAAHGRPISLRWATAHLATCRYVNMTSRRGRRVSSGQHAPRRRYAISVAEVLRLHSRIRRGDNGVMKICQTCRPDRAASFRGDAT